MQKVFCILVLLFNQARVQEFVRGGGQNRKAFFSMGGGPAPPPGHAPDSSICIHPI